ncbi:complex I intermediate-associated protein 30-domain-containing protein [Echria macrotheca]|uniref:Complex I intermediate-associated protein 30-domain-containing protein n=1 Tax=Echria macrotheca TaxID=438768 RepID=A0AAJ0BCS8_9PEZI|nr:complex I intermediate-associated protein 30-domain-containing protein [Echria macrotheca]
MCRPWGRNLFVPCNDSIRGGKSNSTWSIHFEHFPLPVFPEDRVRDGNLPRSTAIFSGYLAPLPNRSNAAFASQRTPDTYQCPDLSGYDGLVIDVPASDGKTYTVVLKDVVPRKRPDGRDESTVVWEHNFFCPGSGGGGRVVLHFENFKPFYRGKELKREDVPPLNLSNITRISIMIRSFFGKQRDNFIICFLLITAFKYLTDPVKEHGSTVKDKSAAGRWAAFLRRARERWNRWKQMLIAALS